MAVVTVLTVLLRIFEVLSLASQHVYFRTWKLVVRYGSTVHGFDDFPCETFRQVVFHSFRRQTFDFLIVLVIGIIDELCGQHELCFGE